MKLVIDISEGDYDWIRRWAKDGTQVPVYDTLARYIANGKVLSEEQEHKTGKWHYYRCSECKCLCTYFLRGCYVIDVEKRPNYCPHCGAKMEGRDEGV